MNEEFQQVVECNVKTLWDYINGTDTSIQTQKQIVDTMYPGAKIRIMDENDQQDARKIFSTAVSQTFPQIAAARSLQDAIAANNGQDKITLRPIVSGTEWRKALG